MAPTDEKTEVVLPAEVPEDLLLPSDPKVIFLGGLFVLAVLVGELQSGQGFRRSARRSQSLPSRVPRRLELHDLTIKEISSPNKN